MNKLIITTDMGRVKAYRVQSDDIAPKPSIETVCDENFSNQEAQISDRVTDQAGRFPKGNGANTIGERHNEEEHARKVRLKKVADLVQQVATDVPQVDIYFAAPQSSYQQLLQTMSPTVKSRFKKTLALDLVKTPKLEVLNRFTEV